MPRKKKTETSAENVWGKILTGDANEYLPLFEFAKQLKLKEEYLIGLAKSGRLKAFKIDDYWLSTAVWVKEWLEEVKDSLHQEITTTTELTPQPEQPIKEEAKIMEGSITPPSLKPAAIARPRRKKISPAIDLDTAKKELLEEISKAEEKMPGTNWVRYLESHSSLWDLLNTPLRLAPAPQRVSANHYALILALAITLMAGLFIYTSALAGF